MENKKIHTQITFEKVSPMTYNPNAVLSKERSRAFTCRMKLPLIEELYHFKQPNVSPDRYLIKDEVVKQTRFSKILAGGSSPKDSFIANKNPGPGSYKEGNTISEISMSNSKNQSEAFTSTMGKSWYQSALSPSARACSFAKPHSGEPFTNFGFMKAHNHDYQRQESVTLAISQTKCSGDKNKTLDLLDFLRLNDRILRYKKRTIQNIEDAIIP